MDEATRVDGGPSAGERPPLAVVVRPRLGRLPAAPGRWRLPARLGQQLGERLPALWDGGRGPLAQAAAAGGLVLLGSVVGRLAGEAKSTALVPRRGTAPAVPSAPAAVPSAATARRTEVLVETAIVEGHSRWGGRPRGVRILRQRISLLHD